MNRETLCLNCVLRGCEPTDTWCLYAIWTRHDDQQKREAAKTLKRKRKQRARNADVYRANVAKARAVRSQVTAMGLRKYDKRTNRTGVLNLVKAKQALQKHGERVLGG